MQMPVGEDKESIQQAEYCPLMQAFLSHKLIDYMKHAVFVVGLCDKSAFSNTAGCALAMATPSPAVSIMVISLYPSPQQIISSAVRPLLVKRRRSEWALSMPGGMISRKNGSEQYTLK